MRLLVLAYPPAVALALVPIPSSSLSRLIVACQVTPLHMGVLTPVLLSAAAPGNS